MHRRKATTAIENWVKTKNNKVLVIQGARQTGKTYINKMSEKKKQIIGYILFIVFSACIYIGANSQEIKIVLQKACQICMECIGLG